jgi:hypothetical protein
MPITTASSRSGAADTLTAEELARAMVSNPRWAERLGWGRHAEAIAVLVGAVAGAPAEAAFARAVGVWQGRAGLAVDGIIGPDTWKAVSAALSPPASLTGIVPPGLPAVPEGFDEVLALYGDPRPLLAPDGTLTAENEALWQRQTLSRGELPFPIALDPAHPEKGTKTTFYAHRKLVSAFAAVFGEIDRLGLRAHLRSWGGIYNFRPIRGTTTRLSLHCFGAAIDLNSESNALGTAGDMHAGIIDIFEHFGFFWGGNFRGRPDPMHFQYARGY